MEINGYVSAIFSGSYSECLGIEHYIRCNMEFVKVRSWQGDFKEDGTPVHYVAATLQLTQFEDIKSKLKYEHRRQSNKKSGHN